MSVVDSGKAPGLNSRTSACGPSVRGRRAAAFLVIAMGFHAAQGEPRQDRLGKWPPRSPGLLGHPPRPSLSLVELRHLFESCFLGPAGYLHLRGQNNDFSRSGRNQGSMGLERCNPGPANGRFGWPYSRFGRARYLSSDPRLGYLSMELLDHHHKAKSGSSRLPH